MKTSTSCACHTEPDACASGVLERPRYYARQLLTPAELTLEQQYFRDKLRRHNRLLHGWGVACGAIVCRIPEKAAADPARKAAAANDPTNQPAPVPKAKPWLVRITPGYILGPYGDEILIDREVTFDLRTCGLTGVTGEPGEPADPWCADVYVQRRTGPLFVAVRYKEMQSRPVRVQPAGCGCDDTQCEYSRWRDGYEICALTERPSCHEQPPSFDDLFKNAPVPGCPDCPADPWVVLAQVDVDADGTIQKIDNCSCRRIVVSWANLWWRCAGDSCAIESVEIVEGQVEPGRTFTVAVKTRLLPIEKAQVRLGDGIDAVGEARVSPGRLEADFSVKPEAKPGARNLEIVDVSTQQVVAAMANAVTVLPKQGAGGTASPTPPPPAPPNTPQGGAAPATPESIPDETSKSSRKGKTGGK